MVILRIQTMIHVRIWGGDGGVGGGGSQTYNLDNKVTDNKF